MAVCLKAIGRNIRELRRDKGMTQAQTAEMLGMTGLHYGRLERGERNVSLDQLDRLAGLFGVPVIQLVRGAFPDAPIEHAGEGALSDFVRSMAHVEKSLSQKERELAVTLCQMMAHGK